MTRPTLDRFLDALGWAAVAAPAMMPASLCKWWVLLACGAVAYASGKTSRPGVPFVGTKAAPSDVIPEEKRKPSAA